MENYAIPLSLFKKSTERRALDSEEIALMTKAVLDGVRQCGLEGNFRADVLGPTRVRFMVALNQNIEEFVVNELALVLSSSLSRDVFCTARHDNLSVEIPKAKRGLVELGELLEDEDYRPEGKFLICIGIDARGKGIFHDLSGESLFLVVGQTGTGKSTFLNALLCNLLYSHSPDELQLSLIDLKGVELCPLYKDLPHLREQPVSTFDKALSVLKAAIDEMEVRFALLSAAGGTVRNIEDYNCLHPDAPMKRYVIFIDEISDLKRIGGDELEGLLVRLAQKCSAVGIHLVAATQRPTEDVVSDLLIANAEVRMVFRLYDVGLSKRFLGNDYATKIFGRGEGCLYAGIIFSALQTPFVSLETIGEMVDYIKSHYGVYTALEPKPTPVEPKPTPVNEPVVEPKPTPVPKDEAEGLPDPYCKDALRYTIENGSVSISWLQRRLGIGYNRSGRILEWMEEEGYISAFDGSKARQVYATMEDFQRRFGEGAEEEAIPSPKQPKERVLVLKEVVRSGRISAFVLQRKLGFKLDTVLEALRWMEREGYISNTQPRKVLLSKEAFYKLFGE